MTNLVSITDARDNLPNLVKKAGENIARYLITVNNQPKAVIIGLEELESLEETAEVLSIPGAKQSIKRGLKEANSSKGTSLSDL